MSTQIKPVRLIMVTGDNNNKYYDMTPQGSTFVAKWGRVGVTESTTTYPISKWHSQYNSKIKKGYKDVTDLVLTSAVKSEYKDIPDATIQSLFRKLLGFAKSSVADNYTISSEAVTQAQVTEAQAFIDELTAFARKGVAKEKINKLLLDLYTVIPRRMKKVQDHLMQQPIKTADDLQVLRGIIDAEQKTLDVMAGQVKMHNTADLGSPMADKTILDALGITVEIGTVKDITIVKKFMGSDSYEFRNVFRVEHPASKTQYDHHLTTVDNLKTALFWHGSRNENWISILQTGLKIRPSNAILNGSMFGDGIYFANKYRKSANYTSMRGSHWTRGTDSTGFLALLNVHLGKQLEVTRHSHDCYKYSKAYLQQKGGFHSVYAKGGYDLINDEFIVYDNAQCTIEYLIEVGK